ncbi:hypothetical protein F7725_029097 [Dissostichus mawsoni]|uniref:Uncharacterized protein n=1 Tax=Dissostichus mawsoni TaxID=36200 RepID=A0A7J5XIY2_DISMA|nr:hypothetical protein F7725_029097 [Dissostichus mawsoni]
MHEAWHDPMCTHTYQVQSAANQSGAWPLLSCRQFRSSPSCSSGPAAYSVSDLHISSNNSSTQLAQTSAAQTTTLKCKVTEKKHCGESSDNNLSENTQMSPQSKQKDVSSDPMRYEGTQQPALIGQASGVILEGKQDQWLPYHYDLLASVFSLCLPEYPSLEEVQCILGQSVSQGAEEGMIVGRVVDHEQDPCQQLIGHQQVVQILPLIGLRKEGRKEGGREVGREGKERRKEEGREGGKGRMGGRRRREGGRKEGVSEGRKKGRKKKEGREGVRGGRKEGRKEERKEGVRGGRK